MDKLEILERFSFFADAPPRLRERIQRATSTVTLQAGDVFYNEGDLREIFAIVGRGDLRVFKVTDTGREIALYHVQDGEACLVNMLCVFLGRPAMASARAEATTEAVVVPASEFREWVSGEESMRSFVFAEIARRFVGVMTLVEEVAFRKMDVRLAEHLLHRFHRDQATPRVTLTTHEELAAELGTVREVVSRLLKEFERTGVVAVSRGRLELRDEARLRGVAGLVG